MGGVKRRGCEGGRDECLSLCVQANGEGDDDTQEKDVYDTMLTRGEIQDGVESVNTTVKREEAEEKCKA